VVVEDVAVDVVVVVVEVLLEVCVEVLLVVLLVLLKVVVVVEDEQKLHDVSQYPGLMHVGQNNVEHSLSRSPQWAMQSGNWKHVVVSVDVIVVVTVDDDMVLVVDELVLDVVVDVVDVVVLAVDVLVVVDVAVLVVDVVDVEVPVLVVDVDVAEQMPHVKSQSPALGQDGQNKSAHRLTDGGLHVGQSLLVSAQNWSDIKFTLAHVVLVEVTDELEVVVVIVVEVEVVVVELVEEVVERLVPVVVVVCVIEVDEEVVVVVVIEQNPQLTSQYPGLEHVGQNTVEQWLIKKLHVGMQSGIW